MILILFFLFFIVRRAYEFIINMNTGILLYLDAHTIWSSTSRPKLRTKMPMYMIVVSSTDP